MAQIEGEAYALTQRYLRGAEQSLARQDATCMIDVMGVIHAGDVQQDVLDKAVAADVVTLELTRKVVQAGLSAETSDVLEKNEFWRGVIDGIRPHAEGKIVRGIEVNQTPRTAWKRYSLHIGRRTLAPSTFSVEIDEDVEPAILDSLTDEERDRFERHKWVIAPNLDAVYEVLELYNDAPETESGPIPLAPGMRVIHSAVGESINGQYDVTFIRPPHPTLLETAVSLKGVLNDQGCLKDHEVKHFVDNAMISYLLAPTEVSGAREIAYFTNQYARTHLDGEQRMSVLHIGGAFHPRVIFDALQAAKPGTTAHVDIRESYEERVGTFEGLIDTFFRDAVPLPDRMRAIQTTGNETTMNPAMVTSQVKRALHTHRKDFLRRIAIERCVRTVYPDRSDIDIYAQAMRETAEKYTSREPFYSWLR